jgi:hypothetical protein
MVPIFRKLMYQDVRMPGRPGMAETGARRIASYLTKICGKVAPFPRFCGRFILSPTGSWPGYCQHSLDLADNYSLPRSHLDTSGRFRVTISRHPEQLPGRSTWPQLSACC